ncbi:bifunctional peptidase and arginyl-hydroxylase JMJD5 [Atheta coriaria]|uniref:bifunctional peptidase and arginyl-hydroxylase JMJD5 n=1 Tax=Dalotia coriaria TaxID=877792 RepID=UPI0031F400CE
MHVIQDLLNLINKGEDLLVPFAKIHPHIKELMIECESITSGKKDVTNCNLRQIEYILCYLHDHLNIGKWDEVAEYYRQAYTSASYMKTLIVLQLNSSFNIDKNIEVVKTALQVIDKGFLLGLPLVSNLTLLTDCARILTKYVSENSVSSSKFNQTEELSSFPHKKQKVEHKVPVSGRPIDGVVCPSIEMFRKEYFTPEKPLVIREGMTTWPAMTKWLDINYLLNIGGDRTVPIEIGSSYSSDDFSQRLMTFRDFIKNYYNAEDGKEIGYLAQHDLLTQIPTLIEDIKVPDYCCLKRIQESDDYNDIDDVEPEINAWIGPKGTVSSLHFDPKDNLLCQVYGAKQIIMFAPSDTKYLYVYDDMPMLSNTSQVDPTNPDLSSFAEFKNATLYTCILQAGEMVYIPPKWWHHIIALEKSFSVNFWWQ